MELIALIEALVPDNPKSMQSGILVLDIFPLPDYNEGEANQHNKIPAYQ